MPRAVGRVGVVVVVEGKKSLSSQFLNLSQRKRASKDYRARAAGEVVAADSTVTSGIGVVVRRSAFGEDVWDFGLSGGEGLDEADYFFFLFHYC